MTDIPTRRAHLRELIRHARTSNRLQLSALARRLARELDEALVEIQELSGHSIIHVPEKLEAAKEHAQHVKEGMHP